MHREGSVGHSHLRGDARQPPSILDHPIRTVGEGNFEQAIGGVVPDSLGWILHDGVGIPSLEDIVVGSIADLQGTVGRCLGGISDTPDRVGGCCQKAESTDIEGDGKLVLVPLSGWRLADGKADSRGIRAKGGTHILGIRDGTAVAAWLFRPTCSRFVQGIGKPDQIAVVCDHDERTPFCIGDQLIMQ